MDNDDLKNSIHEQRVKAFEKELEKLQALHAQAEKKSADEWASFLNTQLTPPQLKPPAKLEVSQRIDLFKPQE
jgi:hypothetical protein